MLLKPGRPEPPTGKTAHFLERAGRADACAAAAGNPEARRAWSDMATIYRQLAALTATSTQACDHRALR